MNYRETGLKALEVVGGKDNVKNLTHCATRLRFEVKDRSKVQMDKLNSVPGVLKALESAGCQTLLPPLLSLRRKRYGTACKRERAPWRHRYFQ